MGNAAHSRTDFEALGFDGKGMWGNLPVLSIIPKPSVDGVFSVPVASGYARGFNPAAVPYLNDAFALFDPAYCSSTVNRLRERMEATGIEDGRVLAALLSVETDTLEKVMDATEGDKVRSQSGYLMAALPTKPAKRGMEQYLKMIVEYGHPWGIGGSLCIADPEEDEEIAL